MRLHPSGQSPAPCHSILVLPRIFLTHQGQILCCTMQPHSSGLILSILCNTLLCFFGSFSLYPKSNHSSAVFPFIFLKSLNNPILPLQPIIYRLYFTPLPIFSSFPIMERWLQREEGCEKHSPLIYGILPLCIKLTGSIPSLFSPLWQTVQDFPCFR